uniref:Uncharacterized protein n=1 Tax=Bacillus phage Adastra TaxID=3143958 RepID=A0AAU8BCN7_9CAUD
MGYIEDDNFRGNIENLILDHIYEYRNTYYIRPPTKLVLNTIAYTALQYHLGRHMKKIPRVESFQGLEIVVLDRSRDKDYMIIVG